jgi:hypothetical protein
MTDNEQAIARIENAVRDAGQSPELRDRVGHAVFRIAGILDKLYAEHWIGHAVRDSQDPVATALFDLMTESWNALGATDREPAGAEWVRESDRPEYMNTRAEVGRKMIEVLNEHGIGPGTA